MAESKSKKSKTSVTVKKSGSTNSSSRRSLKSFRPKAPTWFARIKWPRWMRAIGGYFKGSWQELRQVRWPNRAATWSLTVAVILFSLFLAAVILGLDFVFNYLFKEVLL